jgi:hypothetical protein
LLDYRDARLDHLHESMPDPEYDPTRSRKVRPAELIVEAYASGMESGVVEGYGRLDAILDLLGKS